MQVGWRGGEIVRHRWLASEYRGEVRTRRRGTSANLIGTGSIRIKFLKERGTSMDTTLVIQVVAGVLFVIVLIVLIQRRRTRVK